MKPILFYLTLSHRFALARVAMLIQSYILGYIYATDLFLNIDLDFTCLLYSFPASLVAFAKFGISSRNSELCYIETDCVCF